MSVYASKFSPSSPNPFSLEGEKGNRTQYCSDKPFSGRINHDISRVSSSSSCLNRAVLEPDWTFLLPSPRRGRGAGGEGVLA